jgi:protein tyrosine phosphatase
MKTCDLYGQKIEAYTPTELESLKHHGAIAQNIWYQAWKDQGAQDNGTCTGGKGLRVWYIPKGKRKPQEVAISRCDWVQGNISASRSKDPALRYLEDKGINAFYYDGWMD